jgi:hypothetical protein
MDSANLPSSDAAPVMPNALSFLSITDGAIVAPDDCPGPMAVI